MNTAINPDARSDGNAASGQFLHHNLAATESSHLELRAARELVEGVWEELRANQIELSTELPMEQPIGMNAHRMSFTRIWKNFHRQPADVVVSLLLRVTFVEIFVAESTGSVLSARILSDTVALVSLANCSVRPFDGCSSSPSIIYPGGDAYTTSQHQTITYRTAAYSQQCYSAPPGTDGCNFFYNQSHHLRKNSK